MINVIKNRRNVRKFKPDQIPDSMLNEILECTILAPSARNQQKWHFKAIQNKSIINRMISILR